MRKEAAFNFIPELIGDFSHVMELSVNPGLLYVEAAISTLHTAMDIFTAFETYENTKRKKEIKQELQHQYEDLGCVTTSNYQIEELQRLDIEFEKVKSQIRNGKFHDKVVRDFLKYLQKDFKRFLEAFQQTQIDPDYPEKTKVEEITRRALRDYNKLLYICIEEEENSD